MKITDAHTHIMYHNGNIEEIRDTFKGIMGHFGIDKLHFLSIPHHDNETYVLQSHKCLYLKDTLSSYASASLVHFFDERDTREEFLNQAKLFHKLGFDGYKMLEGKPGLRKKTGFALNDPVYWSFYEYAEENGIPIVLHAADPETFWDITAASEYQIEKGWIYDESFPSKEDIRKEVWGIMENFPKLKLTLAHMGFLYYNKDNTVEFLERWENTAFDLVINPFMMNLAADDFPFWDGFIHKHLSRFIFGSDLYPFNFTGKDNRTYEEVFNRLERLLHFLKAKDSFVYGDVKAKRGLGLTEDEFNTVCYENHKNRYGEIKMIDRELLLTNLSHIKETEKLSDKQIVDLDIIRKHFTK